MLLEEQPDAARLAVYGGENILHLCVKRYQLEALKLLMKKIGDSEFINSKDTEGNTVLHLAVADKQVETINYLLSVATLEVNSLNPDGMTAVDVLIRSRRDVRDLLIKESLKHAGGLGTLETNIQLDMNQNMATQPLSLHQNSSTSMQKKSWEWLLKQHGDWLEKKKSALMVVASLIATMAFQVGVNPPCGVYQENNYSKYDGSQGIYINEQGNRVVDPHHAGYSILASGNPTGYTRLYIANTTGFIASLSIILLLMSGLPIRRRIFMWILMVITWIAITATALTYTWSIIALSPDPFDETFLYLIGFSVVVWLCLMALLLIGHTIRLLVKMIKKLTKKLRRTAAGTAVLEDNVAP